MKVRDPAGKAQDPEMCPGRRGEAEDVALQAPHPSELEGPPFPITVSASSVLEGAAGNPTMGALVGATPPAPATSDQGHCGPDGACWAWRGEGP